MRLGYRWILASCVAWALAGCQSEDLGLSGSGTGNFTEGSDATEPSTDGLPSSGPVDATVDFLSAFFVQSFEPYETEAKRLREEDPRFLIQRNSWSISGGSTVYESYPLAAARVEYAQAAGLTGAGQTVSVIDSGFLASHEVFAGTDLSFPLGAPPVERHGTAVASIIAGRSDIMTGLAPGARLSLSSFDGTGALADATREAARIRAVAQNNSWGYEIDATRQNFDIVFNSQPDYFQALADYARRGVVVFATSNDNARTRSTLMESLPSLVPQLESGWLSVVNAVPVFDSERVTSAALVSSACFETARWCLAADGTWAVAGTDSTTHYRFATGTSFAAPQVSGALALLGEAFPDLTPHELRARLLASADNGFFEHDGALEIAPGFFHGYNETFGHGFLDLRAALLPIGRTILPAESGGGAEAGEPILMAGAAVGDAVTRALEDVDVLVTDALGGDFEVGAGALVARALPEPLMTGRLALLGDAVTEAARFREDTDVLNALSGQRMRLSAADGMLEVNLVAPVSGTGDTGFGLRRIEQDAGGQLGFGVAMFRNGSGSVGLTSLTGGGSGAWAATLDLEAVARIAPATDLSVFGQVGLMGDPGEDAYADVSSAGFASLGIDLGRRDAFRRGDRIGLGLAMPTAVTSGSASMSLPVAREGGVVAFAPITVDLAPREREMRVSLSYSTPLGEGWSLVAEGVHAMNRGHVAGATDTGALFGLQARF